MIRSGLSATKWVIEPASSIGHLLADRFASEDVISAGDSGLLASRPQLPQDVTLISESTLENGTWRPTRIYLERSSSLPCRLSFSSEIADLLVQWDGSQTLALLADKFAKQKRLPVEQVRQNFLGLARRLAAKNLIKLLQ